MPIAHEITATISSFCRASKKKPELPTYGKSILIVDTVTPRSLSLIPMRLLAVCRLCDGAILNKPERDREGHRVERSFFSLFGSHTFPAPPANQNFPSFAMFVNLIAYGLWGAFPMDLLSPLKGFKVRASLLAILPPCSCT